MRKAKIVDKQQTADALRFKCAEINELLKEALEAKLVVRLGAFNTVGSEITERSELYVSSVYETKSY